MQSWRGAQRAAKSTVKAPVPNSKNAGVSVVSRRNLIKSAAALAVGVLLVRVEFGLADETASIRSASVTENNIDFIVRGVGPFQLLAFPLHADSTRADQGVNVWEGPLHGDTKIAVARLAGPVDRMFHKFQLFQHATGKAIGSQKYVDDLHSLNFTPPSLVWPASIKGASCPVDVKDLVELGVKHTHINLNAAAMIHLDESQRDDAFSRVVDGRRIWLNPDTIRALDRTTRELTDAGINAVGVVTNHGQTPGVLTHPMTDLKHAPNKMGAFNLTNDEGVLHFRALFEFITDRYCRGDRRYGSVGGWIVGNEVQSHWEWHNMGPATLAEVARQYADELRLAWLAVRNAKANVPVFASFDHFWAMPMSKNSTRHLAGRALIDALANLMAREGNFPWHVAQHPYPENLFQPKFWNDKTATFAYDSPRITFKNVEVLADYLRRKEMLCDGKPRRLIFSEQGLHAGDTPESELIQAAAYALAYRRISMTPGVEAFILHRQVDAAREGGLKLGIWPLTGTGVGKRKRPIWEVVKSADTPQWDSASRFALGIIGISDWSMAKPQAGPFPATGKHL